MQLVEQHIINHTDSRFALIDDAAFAAKNLYNAANYQVRQSFIHTGVYLNYNEIYHQVKETEQYQGLPRKVSQQVLMLLDRNWKSFFAAIAAYRANPSAFTGKPGLPKHLDKTKGRAALIYTVQAVSRSALAQQIIKPSGLAIEIKTDQTQIAQVRIVPRSGFYTVEGIVPGARDPALVAGIDIGLNNLATITSNKPGIVPVLVNGRPLKHINQFYNKRKAQLQAKLGQRGSTRLMERITTRRNRQITHYLHTQSSHYRPPRA
ncbi:MAG TPA: transposase [Herpetosiphonaceae bacterium]|nr:transposase [Herpetosiphonaceae bacterium]